MGPRRLHYIDWLRVLAVLLLFPFHTGRVFYVGEAFYVKGPQESTLVTQVGGFIDVWHMPLLFVLAGASTYLALGRRSRREYAFERVRRLLVPFIFGMLLLIPPQTWYGARFNSGYQGSYLHYLISGDFLRVEPGRDDYFGGLGTGHLWFIIFLFIFSLAALPMWGGRLKEDSRLARLSRVLAHPAGWLLAGLALLAANALPEIGGQNPFAYFVFFVLGYLAMCSEEFMDAARRWAWLTVPIGVAGAVWWVAISGWRDTLADPSAALVGVGLAGVTASWLLIIGLLGVGSRLLDRTSPTLEYLAEGSYPVYILHQTAIVAVAFYVVGIDAPWAAQWVAVLAASVALTFLCYEGLRRVAWLRFLFGMRPRAGKPSAPSDPRVGQPF